jgi:hypothetical protein
MVESECRQAVVRAYHSMIDFGEGHHNAFRVAERVFRWHQPETPDEQREARILSWVRPNWLN